VKRVADDKEQNEQNYQRSCNNNGNSLIPLFSVDISPVLQMLWAVVHDLLS
jgi:hypothetical protein